MTDIERREKFNERCMKSAMPNSKVYYVKSVDEVIRTNKPLWEIVILPHPDVTLGEFFGQKKRV